MSQMEITIHNVELAEQPALAKVLDRVTWHWRATKADIYCAPRADGSGYNPAGWLEYLLRMEYDDGGKLTIGCLERSAGAEMEFHS